MCAKCVSLLSPWSRLTGNGCQIVTIGPDRCPNGHPLKPPNVMVRSDVAQVAYECLTCRLTIHRDHKQREQWLTANPTSSMRVDVDGFDPHPLRAEDTMLADRPPG